MPRIIRSSTVNMDAASSVVIQTMKGQGGIDSPAANDRGAMDDAYAAAYANAERVVEEMITKARADASYIVDNAHEETRQVLQDALREGYEQGYQQGLEQGRADGKRELQQMQQAAADEIDSVMRSLREERLSMLRESEQEIVALVFDIVDKVLAVEMDRSEQWVISQVKQAVKQLEGEGGGRLRVNPANLERARAAAEPLLDAEGKVGKLAVAADSALPPGGFVLDTDRGIIDSGVETKMSKLKAAFSGNA